MFPVGTGSVGPEDVDGGALGIRLGCWVGISEGASDGEKLGCLEGKTLGIWLGLNEGRTLGIWLGLRGPQVGHKSDKKVRNEWS